MNEALQRAEEPRVLFRQDRYIVFNAAAAEHFLGEAPAVLIGLDIPRNLIGIRPVTSRHPMAVRIILQPRSQERWIPAFGFFAKHGLPRPTSPVTPQWDTEQPDWVALPL